MTPNLPRPSACGLALIIFFSIIWLAGGASRPEVLGQVIVRSAAGAALIFAAFTIDREAFRDSKAPTYLLLSAITVGLLQLAPLPPELWRMLPGRELFADAAAVSQQAQPWRPLSIVPGATINAVSSLAVPAAALVLMIGLAEHEKPWVLYLLLALITGATAVAAIQLTGVRFDNPLINDSPNQISSIFANRNHLALFLSFGCVIAPAWGFGRWNGLGLRNASAIGLTLLFVLLTLAIGSRAGLLLAVGGLTLGIAIALRNSPASRAYPRWASVSLIAGAIAMIVAFAAISIAADRAETFSRLLAGDGQMDMRQRALPTVLAMTQAYFPVGTGLGTFDPMFRLHEPFDLLKPTYFNHAHNDIVEVVLDAGIAGLILLTATIIWWALASIRVWRQPVSSIAMRGQIGSSMLILLFAASCVDYPARTPLIMATAVIAFLWLSWGAAGQECRGLPKKSARL